MNGTNVLSRLTDQPVLNSIAEPLGRAVRDAYELAGPVGQQAQECPAWCLAPSSTASGIH